MQTRVCSGHDVASFLCEVDDALAAGLKPTLALVFCSVALDLGEIRQGLDPRGLAVVGATTAGEIRDTTMLEESCVALLLEADRAAFDVRLYTVESDGSMLELGRRLGRFAAERFAEPIVLAFISGVKADGEPVVPGIREGAGKDIPLFGGKAGDDLAMVRSQVFSETEITEEGVVGLVLDGRRFEVLGMAASGWQPVGVAKTITRAEGNIVYTIDGRPALEVYRKYLEIDVDQPRLAAGIQYPLRVSRDNGTSVLRPPLYYQADQSIVFAATVPQGARVQFCIPPSIDIVERVLVEAEELRRRFPAADALVVIDCKARQLALGPLAEDELKGLHDLWGAPMAGFFSYGEIGPPAGHCDFHTETCTFLLLREIPE